MGKGKREAEKSANHFLFGGKGKNVILENFRDQFLPQVGVEIKEYFEKIRKEFNPNLIFTHHRLDSHR